MFYGDMEEATMFLAEYRSQVDRAVSGLLEELEADMDFFVQLAGWAAGVRMEACGDY